MQMAIDVAGFTPAESDELRQAMGSKRSARRMERLKERLYAGHGRAGDHRRRRRRAVHEDEGVRQLRLPRVALGELRLPRVRLVVDQVPRAGGVLRGAAQRAADGVLVAAHAGARRPPSRCGRAHARSQRVAGSGDLGAVRVVGGRCRRAVGDRVGARHRVGAGRGDRGDTEGGRVVHRHRGSRAAGAVVDAGAAGGDGDRWAVRRVLRPRPPDGAVDRRCHRAVAARSIARCGHRRCRAAPAGDDPGRGGGRRPVGDRRVTRRASDDLRARGAGRVGRADVGAAVGSRAGFDRPGRRCGHPPSAPDDRAGRHVPQPRGRDRPDQRGGLEGLLGEVPQGGARSTGDADPRPPRAQRRCRQHRRRAPRPAPDAGQTTLGSDPQRYASLGRVLRRVASSSMGSAVRLSAQTNLAIVGFANATGIDAAKHTSGTHTS
jgi:hypothetical protein